MEKMKQYKKLRLSLEVAAAIAAMYIGLNINTYFGFAEGKLLSINTLISLGVFIVLAYTFERIVVMIANRWYKKQLEKKE